MRQSDSAMGGCLLIVVVIASLMLAIYQWLAEHPVLVACIVISLIAKVAHHILAKRETAAALAADKHAMLDRAFALIEKHAAELKLRRKQLTTSANYGLIDDSKWLQEVDRFIDQIIQPQCAEIRQSPEGIGLVRDLIAGHTADYLASRLSFSADMDPIAFEHMVADGLRDLGWQTRLTKGSGDQGVDVVAEMHDKRVVIQCKRYTSAIGNSAVQEAYAGKSFENADYAVVVSNANFTRSARQLAKSTGVVLLHHDELAQLQTRVFGASASSSP